ncbi:ferrous iron transporter B [Cellulomonas chitinilytica]|uniref:Ferrous iron transport protein B n=1 Tax=Cellulomonas chitinilytica TaxID=398759 RepID=A0A919P361_9CELL|nr:ferrous iron transport protein B [Cellulomonas chitinilytica]GIG20791.1 ferrous iron transporter B [Cellulomonas chitinilytica]
MSCHDTTEPLVGTGLVTVALVGSPNVGKSTLFNSVTGARQRVVNAPGTTVELASGTWRGAGVTLLDLPGAYSLHARSPDEAVTADTLAGRGPDVAAAVVLVDATAVARSLYLVGQVASTGVPAVVALTMRDVAAARGIVVDPVALSDALGVPVVGVDPRTGDGVDDLTATVRAAVARPRRLRRPALPDGAEDRLAEAEALFGWVQQVMSAAGLDRAAPRSVRTWSDRVDAVLLRPWVGLPALLAVMWVLFELVTVAATPLMDGVDAALNGWLGGGVRTVLGPAPGWVASFVVDGVLAGVTTVLSFVPLMALIFVAIALLEDSGYLARAAFVADRAMRAVGLDGRAVIPLVVGFGCNLPALSATRVLPHARQRLLTGLLVPLTSCTARLTVYLMLASVFFPRDPGTVVLAMYVVSALLVVGAGAVLRRTFFRDVEREPFVLALPAYQRPRLRSIAASTWVRVRSFVTKAGAIIVTTLSVVWVLMAVPAVPGHHVADVPVEDSVYGRVADGIAPVFAPAGFADWHASAALMTGFVAKEVVVGSMAQTYAVTEPSDPSEPGDLGSRLAATFETSSGGAPSAAALAFLLFVLAYTPCLATMAEQARLFGWRWTGGAVVAQLVLAWLLAVATFQVGRLL